MNRLSRMAIGMVASAAIGIVGGLGAGSPASAATTVIQETFDVDPLWEGVDNMTGNQNYGYSDTNNTEAASGAGEIGGMVDRDPFGYYAADVGDLDPSSDALTMSGTMYLNIDGNNDGQAFVGWFDKEGLGVGATPSNFMGFRLINDPPYQVRVLWQVASNNLGQETVDQFGLGIADEVPFEYEFTYDPTAFFNQGQISVSINGGSPVEVPMPTGAKDAYANFDRFGIISSNVPGSQKSVELYLDDVAYTANETVAFPLGDFDRDDEVTLEDFDVMKDNWLTSGHAQNELGEVTGDGIVDLHDFKLFKEQLYTPSGSGASIGLSIPEPATLWLLTLAVPFVFSTRFRGQQQCRSNTAPAAAMPF